MIDLINFNKNDETHLELLSKLYIDKDINNNVSSILFPKMKDYYVVSFEGENIGILKLIKEHNGDYSVDLGILKEYRNKGYGSDATKSCIDLVESGRKIIIRTKFDNKSAIYSAKNSGFKFDPEEAERCDTEGVDYYVLSYKKQ